MSPIQDLQFLRFLVYNVKLTLTLNLTLKTTNQEALNRCAEPYAPARSPMALRGA